MRTALLAASFAVIGSAAMAQTPGLYSTKQNPQPPLAAPVPPNVPFGYANPQHAPQPAPVPTVAPAPVAVPDSPQQRFVPVVPQNTPGMLTPPQAQPNTYQPTVPFGRAGPEALVPAPTGPRTSVAAPVENIEAGEVGIAAPAEITAEDVPPATQDPTLTTPQTGAVFEEEFEGAGPRELRLRGLNKVTAQSEEVKVMVGDTVRFGLLEITPRACRVSKVESQPESAALLEVLELPPGEHPDAMLLVKADAPKKSKGEDEEAAPKPVFNGWMFASSPSLSGLEHPVYDLSLIGCGEAKEVAAAPANTPAEKAE